MITIACCHCGRTLVRFPSQVKPRNFCDRRCQGLWRSANMTATDAPNWRRGSRISAGYVEVFAPWSSSANARGYAPLHRLIMEIQLGRPLDLHEIVHHRDGDKMNNHPQNLLVTTQSEHIEMHRAKMVEARRGR